LWKRIDWRRLIRVGEEDWLEDEREDWLEMEREI
jgi:hypothetical protein